MNGYISTTTVLKVCGFYDDMDAAGAANQAVGFARGSALHKAVHYLAMGQEPPWASPHPELDGYLDGYRLFRKEHDWKMEECEAEWINHAERIISHPDQFGVLDGHTTVIEIKTGALPKWVGLQVAGQLIAKGDIRIKRMALSLPGDGKYRLVPLTEVRDFSEFRILLQACHVRAKHQGEFWRKENE
jgi:hypothetical protein